MVHYAHPLEGIDEPIYRLNQELNDQLTTTWQMGEKEYQCYGRVHRNPTAKGFVPEVYKGDSNYNEVLLDDAYVATSFWGVGDTTVDGSYNLCDVHAIFFVHLGRAKPGNPNRMDLGVREDVQRVLGQDLFGFTMQRIIVGDRVLREYNISRSGVQGTGDKYMDMQPFHVFRMEGSIRYPKPTFINS